MALTLSQIITLLAGVPTAPFREHWVCRVLDTLLRGIPGIEVQADAFGNRIARLRKGKADAAPMIFVAHMDHPGFIFRDPGVARRNEQGFYPASFEGNVADSFFPDAAVRFFRSAGDPGVPGRVAAVPPPEPASDSRRVLLEGPPAAEGALLAMWDLTGPVIQDGLISCRVCDDLMGCAAIVEILRRASEEERADVCAVFTRAEEAGFCGALRLAGTQPLPPPLPGDGILISVETSSELPGVSLGDGVVVRIGDKVTTFDGPLSDTIWRLALSHQIRAIRFLMSGGTCEATVFSRAGLRTGALCIPLRNYHNMDRAAGRIAPEIIALSDIQALCDLMFQMSLFSISGGIPSIPAPFNDRLFLEKAQRNLHPIPLTPPDQGFAATPS
ncbi:MAG TPA: hypothetical protein PLB62_06435 [Candidatus Sumerlaeota bacterium]|nr:hypothetical protein [Candidatus Sumerlaeota bacterium]